MTASKHEVFFDKSKSYVRDYSASALTANGTGLSLSLAAVINVATKPEIQLPFQPILVFTAGLFAAFFAHVCIWIINDNLKNAERRDAMFKFYLETSKFAELPEEDGGLTGQEISMLDGLHRQITDFQGKMLKDNMVSFVSKTAATLYFFSLALFAIGVIWCIVAVLSVVW